MIAKSLYAAGLIALATTMQSGLASATTFSVTGTTSNPKADVQFTYSWSSPTAGSIEIRMTNNSTGFLNPNQTATVYPVITGFAFNTPSNILGVTSLAVSGTGDNSTWYTIPAPPAGVIVPDSISTNPAFHFGLFDIAGAASDENPFESGLLGFPGGAPGVQHLDTGVITLGLSGTGMNLLNEASFLALLSSAGSDPVATPVSFAVFFNRIGNFAFDGDIGVYTAPIPIPAALPLFATGFAAVAYAGRCKRKAKASRAAA